MIRKSGVCYLIYFDLKFWFTMLWWIIAEYKNNSIIYIYISMTYYRKPGPPRFFFVEIINSLSLQLSRFLFPIPGNIGCQFVWCISVQPISSCRQYAIFCLPCSKIAFWYGLNIEDLTNKISFGWNVFPQSLLFPVSSLTNVPSSSDPLPLQTSP